jgi:hypothetical protein
VQRRGEYARVAVVDAKQVGIRGGRRLLQDETGLGRTSRAQTPVLVHGEAVAGRQRQHEVIAVEKPHRRHILDTGHRPGCAANAVIRGYTRGSTAPASTRSRWIAAASLR